MSDTPNPDKNLEIVNFLLSSFTDNGKSLRAFTTNPQELAITILTAGLLANSKLMIGPEDAVKSAFDIHARIQKHVSNFQNIQFAANIENCFGEQPPETEHY
jgi:lauroyl/myristoyl acyltransferase|tara:strand:- start:1220 stop:1525 length:306 start_codon:yes stop_codon:yes gene_type:complete